MDDADARSSPDSALAGQDERFAERILRVGGGLGVAALVLSLLVTIFWNPAPQRPQLPQLPEITVPSHLDVPTDVPTDFPTFATGGSGELPDVGDSPELPEMPEFPNLPTLPGGN